MLTTHNPTKIAALNDAARKSFSGCRVYMTPGVQALYVQECGGIEEVRRVPKAQKASTMSKDDYKKLALDGLADVQVGVSTFELPTFIQPNTDYEEDYAVALVRCHDDGTGTIVYGLGAAA